MGWKVGGGYAGSVFAFEMAFGNLIQSAGCLHLGIGGEWDKPAQIPIYPDNFCSCPLTLCLAYYRNAGSQHIKWYQ